MAKPQTSAGPALARHLRGRTAAVMAWIEAHTPKAASAIAPQTTDGIIEDLQSQGVTDAVIAASLSQLRRRGYTFSTSVKSTKIGFLANEPLKSRGDRSQSPETQVFSDDEEFRTGAKVVSAKQLEVKFQRAERVRDQEEMVKTAEEFQEMLGELLDQFAGKRQPGRDVGQGARHIITSIRDEIERHAPTLAAVFPHLSLHAVDRAQLRERLPPPGRAQFRPLR